MNNALTWKMTSIKTVRERREMNLTGADLRKALGLSDKARITVHVPGGGDWSNCDLDLDDYTLDIVEEKEWVE